jgi:hypothetical protein
VYAALKLIKFEAAPAPYHVVGKFLLIVYVPLGIGGLVTVTSDEFEVPPPGNVQVTFKR